MRRISVGGCGENHLDLSRAAWEALSRPRAVDMTIMDGLLPRTAPTPSNL